MIKLLKSLKRQVMIYKNGFHKINGDLDKVIIFNNVEIAHPERLKLGSYIRIGHHSHIDAFGGVNIKNGVIFSSWVTVLSSSHNYRNPNYLPFDNTDTKKSVLIDEGTWLAWGCTILPGVKIGKNCIVSAKSVVTKDVPDNSIVAGIPAKVIGEREISDKLKNEDSVDKFYQYQVIEHAMKR
ncbi:MAG: acyltransferase [Pelagibacteraceae bacterium TMED124]|nr:MAG: acyltransferase [Pelagibacteraceae bacterium TMED124]|tara:strand:+ start:5449 stop:5994 length:546 start_codon:yes stop_codon:yes gene_type:complete